MCVVVLNTKKLLKISAIAKFFNDLKLHLKNNSTNVILFENKAVYF